MADIPTIQELKDQIENDLRTELGISTTWVGKVILRVIASVQAAKLKLYYIAIGKVQKNIFADTADTEEDGGTLERFGRVKLGRNPYPAGEGLYTLDVTGEAGGTISKGSVYKSTDNSQSPGYLFSVENEVTLTGTTGQVEVRSLETGVDAGLLVDDELELTAPIANVDNLAKVATVDLQPVAAESEEDYRNKTLEAFRLEPQGGASSDYRLWALDVSGVRTAYAYTKDGEPFAVQSYIESLPEDSAPGEPDGVPPDSMLEDVEEVYELDPDITKPLSERGRRPLGVFNLEVLAVIPVEVEVTIYDLSEISSTIEEIIETAIINYLYTVRPYIAGADGERKNDTLYLSKLNAAVADALGNEVFYSNIEMTVDGTPTNSYTFGDTPATFGNYPYLYNLIYI